MAPRKSKVQQVLPPSPTRTLVLDNGAYTIKAGFVSHDSENDHSGSTSTSTDHHQPQPQPQPRLIPNCIARDRDRKTYVGSELEKCKDFGEIVFRRPVEKGFIVNWEAQKEIWEREFLDDKAPQRCDPSETRLLLAEHPNSLPVLQTNCDQMVFEEFGFASYYRGNGTQESVFLRCSPLPATCFQLLRAGYGVLDTGY